ncbi:hypothetical protein DRN69_02230, partial [Candidatus Pacearchaeota archaeon]
IERIKQGKKFIETCKKSKKEIIAIKAGKSQQGKKATISHTGSLATDFEIYKGAFKQANVKIKDSLSSIFNLKKQNLASKIKGKKVAIITNAGGAGALITDYLVEKGFDVSQPIDLIGTALAKDYKKALEKLRKYDSIIVILTPQKMSNPEKTAQVLTNFSDKKKIIGVFLGDKSIKKAKKILEKENIPCITRI